MTQWCLDMKGEGKLVNAHKSFEHAIFAIVRYSKRSCM